MRLEELICAIEPVSCTGSLACEVRGVASDSRHVREGFLFVAIAGTQTDGHQHLPDALSRGAVACVTQHDVSSAGDTTSIRVTDSRAALGMLAARFHGDPSKSLKTIGITGTNGKTSTAYMCAGILERAGMRPGLIGTIEYKVAGRTIPAVRTTPEPVVLQALLAEMVHEGCRAVVLEVSSHAVVQKRVQGTDFDVAVFTNLTRDHLDYHDNMQDYFDAKAGFVRGLSGDHDCHALINIDDAWGEVLASDESIRAERIPYGFGAGALARGHDVEQTQTGGRCRVVTPWGDGELSIDRPGRFNLRNALAAVGACAAMGVEFSTCLAAVAQTARVPGRLEEVESNSDFRVLVDYAHTDDALDNVLTTLRDVAAGRIILVFGCGGDRDRTKRPAMGRVAARLADWTVLTSDNPRSEDPGAIISDIRSGFARTDGVEVEQNRRDAIAKALDIADAGDIVLIAGKGHENFQDLGNKVIPFDDCSVARELLKDR